MNEQRRAWRLRLILVACLAVCVAITAALATHRSAHPLIGRYSIAALAAISWAAIASLGLGVLVCLPAKTWSRFENWVANGLGTLRGEIPSGNFRTASILLVFAVTAYSVIASRLIWLNAAPLFDQADYLIVARHIRGMGGATELWCQLWSGKYLEANRHPLYTALLSLWPEFVAAKWFSWSLGLATVGLAWYCVKSRQGGLVGGLAAVLIATNSVFQDSASLVACEILLTIWSLLAWFAIERIVLQAENLSSRYCIVQCVVVGVCLGLGYLTKASAFFLLAGFFVWSLTAPGVRRWSWVALVAFAVVSSPLLVRNIRAFGDPLYSFNNRFLFADTFDQGLDREFRGTGVEAGEYWRTHSAAQVTHRIVSGLAWEGFILLRSLGPAALTDSRPLVGSVILLVAVIGAIGSDRRMVLAALAWLVPFYLFFSWYVPIAAGDRFLAPIVPVLLIFAGRGTVVLINTSTGGTESRLERRVIVVAALWCIVLMLLSFKEQFKIT